MARYKQRHIVLTKVLESAAPVPFRVVVEGITYGEPRQVKQRAMEEIEAVVDRITGAKVIYVTTLRGTNGTLPLRAGGQGSKGLAGSRPGSHPIQKEEDQPKPTRRVGGRLSSGKDRLRQLTALLGNKVRRNWTDEELRNRIKAAGLMTLAKQKGFWPYGKLGEDSEPEVTSNKKKEKRRAYRPRDGVVEELPNGTRVYTDGSRITARGRYISPERVKQLQEHAEKMRQHKQVESEDTERSFPSPPDVSHVRHQEGPTPEQVIEQLGGEESRTQRLDREVRQAVETTREVLRDIGHSEGATPRPSLGQRVKRTLGWRSFDAPPQVTDLPEQSDEEWWDNIVRAYLRPDTDPVALCHNNHITMEALNHELALRGVRPYRGVTSQAIVPPPRIR